MPRNQIINTENQLTVDLFHGTSSLFLDSIIQNGLGGINPVKELNLLDLSKEVCDLSEIHLQETNLYEKSSYSFKLMVEQSSNSSRSFNFQHGDSYLSPTKQTAARYAINKEYGSEILTYTLNFLKELLNKEIPYVKTDLFQRFPKIFGLINSRPSPILIQVKNVKVSSLLSEHGEDPKLNLAEMQEMLDISKKMYDLGTQQTNFRLTEPVASCDLKYWLINVQKWNPLQPEYNLYEIQTK